MLVMVVFFIAFRWIHLSTPLIRLFLLVLILLLMPTLNFLPVWFALSLLRFRLPSRLPMMFILWMVAMMRSEERFSRNAETEIVCRLLLEKNEFAISMATGLPWLGTFDMEPRPVLILDNELHPETIAHRIPKVA